MRPVFFVCPAHPEKRPRCPIRPLAAQSELGGALYRRFGLDPVGYETHILLQDGKPYFRSKATTRILACLGMPWRLLATFGRLVPVPLRDAVYDVVARNRLQWFRARAQCYRAEPPQADPPRSSAVGHARRRFLRLLEDKPQ